MKHRNVRKVGYGGAVAAVTSVVKAAGPILKVASAIGNVVSPIIGVASFMQQRKATGQAAEATTRQTQLQTRLNDINARRQMIQQQREARIRRAQVLTETTGGGLGITGTSSSVGAIGAVSTQEASNISGVRQQGDFGRAIGEAGTEAYTAMGEAKGWSQIGGIAGDIFTKTGGFEKFESIFSS
jgi:hypothetical protein